MTYQKVTAYREVLVGHWACPNPIAISGISSPLSHNPNMSTSLDGYNIKMPTMALATVAVDWMGNSLVCFCEF